MKEYLERQWGKILANRVSVQDFVFAKEVRLGTYSPKAAVVPPAAIVAAKAMATDPRAEPRFAERVPYVVVYGEPGRQAGFVTGATWVKHVSQPFAVNQQIHQQQQLGFGECGLCYLLTCG